MAWVVAPTLPRSPWLPQPGRLRPTVKPENDPHGSSKSRLCRFTIPDIGVSSPISSNSVSRYIALNPVTFRACELPVLPHNLAPMDDARLPLPPKSIGHII